MVNTNRNYGTIGDATPESSVEKKNHSLRSTFRSFLFDKNRLVGITQKLPTINTTTITNYEITDAITDEMLYAESSSRLYYTFANIQNSLQVQDRNKQYIMIGQLVLAKLNKELFPLPQEIDQNLMVTKGAELDSILKLFTSNYSFDAKDKMVIGLLMTAALNEAVKAELEQSVPQAKTLMAQYVVAVELGKLQGAMIGMSEEQMLIAAHLSVAIAMITVILLTTAFCLLLPGLAAVPLAVLFYAMFQSTAVVAGAIFLYRDIKSERHEGLKEFFAEQKEQVIADHFRSNPKEINQDNFQKNIADARNVDQVIDELAGVCNTSVRALRL